MTDTTTSPASADPADPGRTYVVLRKVDNADFIIDLASSSDERKALAQMRPLIQGLVDSVAVWRELGTVAGMDRPAAWANAQRDFATEMPQDVGQQGHVQLVPDRFWRTITMVVEQPPPQTRVEGL